MNKYRLREKEMTKLVYYFYYFKLSYWSSKKQTKKLIISSSLHTLKFQQNSSSENVRSILKTTINITGTKQKVFFLLNVILSLNQTKSIWFFFENDKSVLCKQLELPELESLKYTWYIIEPLFFFFLPSLIDEVIC